MFLASKYCVDIAFSTNGVWNIVDNIITNLICEYFLAQTFSTHGFATLKKRKWRNGIIEIITQENNTPPSNRSL